MGQYDTLNGLLFKGDRRGWVLKPMSILESKELPPVMEKRLLELKKSRNR